MRVLVCGGRYYENSDAVHQELIQFHWRTPISVIIHGGVSGAGAAAEAWARRNRVDVVRYPPNWECFGKRAERLRNDFMLADCRPDFVIVFPGGRDTADLVAKALAAGIQVLHAPSRLADKNMIDDAGATDGVSIPREHASTHST
jgi:YspA, cpYpsA-related SLOG family